MTIRKNSRKVANDPAGLASRLPRELQSFDGWYYPNGLSDYMATLSRFVGEDQRLTPVMNAAGLSAADWFGAMLKNGVGLECGARC